ncbi:hypothetical protein EON63_00505 [archaeon]|nr:MAG: hypothetical protein EON63_00505 [archaeon]
MAGLKMKVIEQVVSITLTGQYIRDSSRLEPEDGVSEENSLIFLREAEDALSGTIEEFKTALGMVSGI